MKNKITTLIPIMLLAACSNPVAISPEVYASSWHSKETTIAGKPYNQRNLGIGLSLTTPVSEHWRLGGRGATYRNSIDRQSNYAALQADYCRGDKWHICGGFMGGGVTGYEKPIKPLVAPVLGVGYDRVTLNLTSFPIQNGRGVAVSGWISIKAGEF